jgi:hypothetical protein
MDRAVEAMSRHNATNDRASNLAGLLSPRLSRLRCTLLAFTLALSLALLVLTLPIVLVQTLHGLPCRQGDLKEDL